MKTEDRLPLKFFAHAGLPCISVERSFFERSKDVIELDGPWPGSSALSPKDRFLNDIVSHIMDGEVTFDGRKRERRVELVHSHVIVTAARRTQIGMKYVSGSERF